MARIRTIKPDFFTSLTVADLTYEARLTFIGLWTHADDQGRCVDDARLVKAAVWPLDERTAKDVDADLWELADAALILRYTVGSKKFIAVRSWGEHQRINRPSKAKLPAPEEGEPTPKAPGGLSEDSRRAHGGLSEDSREPHPVPREGSSDPHSAPEMPESDAGVDADSAPPPGAVVLPMFTSENTTSDDTHGGLSEDSLKAHCGKGKERKGKEGIYSASSPDGEGDSEPSSPRGGYEDPRFQKFWARYPHKVSKKKACAAFFKALKRTDFEHLMDGLERYITQDRRALDGYVKDPTTWLNGDCWDDEPLRAAANGGPAPAASHTSIRNEWMNRR